MEAVNRQGEVAEAHRLLPPRAGKINPLRSQLAAGCGVLGYRHQHQGRPAADSLGGGDQEAAQRHNSVDNPDANCLPLGIHPLHTHPDPRQVIQTPKLVVMAWESNYGLRFIHTDGRKLPPLGEPQPWWYGYSVGRWEGDTLVVETNNVRGAEMGPYDGWLDVDGSPHSNQVKFTERFRRPTFGKLEIDLTVEDPKAYTKPFTVRINQQLMADDELIEFICNENQQFRRRVKVD